MVDIRSAKSQLRTDFTVSGGVTTASQTSTQRAGGLQQAQLTSINNKYPSCGISCWENIVPDRSNMEIIMSTDCRQADKDRCSRTRGVGRLLLKVPDRAMQSSGRASRPRTNDFTSNQTQANTKIKARLQRAG